jgi:nucleoside-diphosphate-sugar epimerase
VRIFVTGATGVVGRRAVPLLIAAGHQVSGVARRPEKSQALARAGAVPVSVDLFNPADVRRAVAGHDVVINLATHIPGSMLRTLFARAWRENDRLRRDASRILVDAAIAGGVRRFIQESFAPVYPDRGDAWIQETTPIAPVRYNRTIVDAEAAAWCFTRPGRSGVVLRFAAFYGPDAMQLHDMIGLVRKGRAPLPGPPKAYFSSVSHDDAASAVVAALDDIPPGTYNVGDNEPLRHRDFADALAATLGVPSPRPLPTWLPMLMGSIGKLIVRSERISNRKLRAASGWSPRYPSVREGFAALNLRATAAPPEPVS